MLVVHVLPWAFAVAGGADVHVTLGRVLGALAIVAIFVVAGGVVAILLGDATKAKQAIAYGLGWQGTIGGLIQGTRTIGNGGDSPDPPGD